MFRFEQKDLISGKTVLYLKICTMVKFTEISSIQIGFYKM